MYFPIGHEVVLVTWTRGASRFPCAHGSAGSCGPDANRLSSGPDCGNHRLKSTRTEQEAS